MISEIANSLFITYLASEYFLSANTPSSSQSRSRTLKNVNCVNDDNERKKKSSKDSYLLLGILTTLVVVANLLDHHIYLSLMWGMVAKISPTIPSYWVTIPSKFFLAATSYVLALYVDVQRVRNAVSNCREREKTAKNRIKKIPFRAVFLPKVGWAFLKILPAYPFLAVLVSFLFLFVIDLWEFLHLPPEWLNNPIYYGTLYGPFAYTYVYVKREVVSGNHFYPDGHSFGTVNKDNLIGAVV